MGIMIEPHAEFIARPGQPEEAVLDAVAVEVHGRRNGRGPHVRRSALPPSEHRRAVALEAREAHRDVAAADMADRLQVADLHRRQDVGDLAAEDLGLVAQVEVGHTPARPALVWM